VGVRANVEIKLNKKNLKDNFVCDFVLAKCRTLPGDEKFLFSVS
jgi:hypothetical protein